MSRYALIDYRYAVPLPGGDAVMRITCPDCGSLHRDIGDGEETFCLGCGHVLSVSGVVLFASEYPDNWFDNEEYYTGEDPDHPRFWLDSSE